MGLEIERKYLDIEPEPLRERLAALGAVSGGIHFESNIVFDRRNILLEQKAILRLRLKEWTDKKEAVLTLKLPRPDVDDMKVREELETKVADFPIMLQILNGLGYQEVARYEKVRESWFFPRRAADEMAVRVDLDELPFGNFAEIEASPAAADRAVALLGLDKFNLSTKTYYELYQDWLERNNLPYSISFVFDPSARSGIRSGLGLDQT